MPDRKLRVFLCHASQDKPIVRELHQKLSAEGWIEPWLDAKKLLPGQDWRDEIGIAVDAADNVIIFLSSTSINKEGFVQKEMRYAKEIALEKPEGSIFLIPIRLDECEAPRGLRSIQYVDYFDEKKEQSYSDLLESLKIRLEEKIRKEAEEEVKRAAEERIRRQAAAELARKAAEEKVRLEAEERARQELKEKIEQEARAKVWREMEARLRLEAEARVRVEYEARKTSEVSETSEVFGQARKPSEEKRLPVVSAVEPSAPVREDKQAGWISIPTYADRLTLNGMEFCLVPAGKFLMGSADSDKLAYSHEEPQHTVDIPNDYWLARFPVTNAQYGEYVKAVGKNHPVSDWQKKKDHPVTQVSWQDAMTYCQWLNDLLNEKLPQNYVLRLPTEAEWEKAARWRPSSSGKGQGEGLIYPWGNTWDASKCNNDEMGPKTTTPVGKYSPQGDSPYGCADMSGNVWEWTHSLFKPYPYQVGDGREDEKAVGYRVLRGGSWAYVDWGVRCAFRYVNPIYSLLVLWGFRVVAAPSLL